jgi:Cys-rich repeat protein
VLAAFGLASASVAACGGNDNPTVTCNQKGMCQVCDALGCHPATANGGGGAGGAGGAGSTTTATTGTGAMKTTSTSTGTGGQAPCDPTQSTCPCDASGKCSGGLVCVNGLCIAGCDFTYQCPSGDVCDNGACVPGCATSADCAAGYTCTKGVCVVDPNNPGCSGSNPGPSGQLCASGVCTTGCTSNSQCASGQVCDGATGACIPDPSKAPGCSTAKPCTAPQVCESDGYCHYPCTSLSDCQHIDDRFVACQGGVCMTADQVSPQCSLTMPCPTGKDCISSQCK